MPQVFLPSRFQSVQESKPSKYSSFPIVFMGQPQSVEKVPFNKIPALDEKEPTLYDIQVK